MAAFRNIQEADPRRRRRWRRRASPIALLVWVFYLDRKVTEQFEGPALDAAGAGLRRADRAVRRPALRRRPARAGAASGSAISASTSRETAGQLQSARRAHRARQSPLPVLGCPAGAAAADRSRRSGNAIESMRNGRGEEVPIFRLDPLLIGSIFPIHGEDRVVVTPEEVSPLLPAALKVVEDRKFDYALTASTSARSLRAAWVNLRAGQIEQGGSTLTQQLVKSYFLDNRRTLGRKIEEAMMAVLLEVHFEQAGPDERVHQRDLSRPGRQPRDARLRSREPVLLRQAARRAAAARSRAAGRDRARSVLLRSAPASGARARAARSGAEADGAARRRRREGGAAGGEAPARHRQRRHAGGRLLPGVPRSRAAHAASRLSRGGSDRSGPADFLDAESAGAEPRREGADAGARSPRQDAQAEEEPQARRRGRGDGAAERRSRRDGRRPAGRASTASIARSMRSARSARW